MAQPLLMVILPEEMNPTVIHQAVIKAMKQETEVHERMFNKATATWTHKPGWKKKFAMTGGDAYSIISTSDKPFIYVERGTRKRWRRMSSDWTSKSKVKRLGSGAGSGKAEGWKRRPYPGIKPRDFRERIVEIRQPRYAVNMAAAFRKGANNLFRGSGITFQGVVR